jgi:hypothetical protein
VGLHARPDQRHLGDVLVDRDAGGPDLVGEGSRTSAGLEGLPRGSVNEMSVVPSSDTFWTIMSMLMLASASA